MTWSSNEFHFLKVELGIDSCEEVTAIERLKHGPEYLWLWIRLALKFANYGGVLCRKIGENILPVTPDDLEAEFKGGFSDVSIKDGVATLIKGSLIYINSDGFMAITGLTISGDPKEPVLHKQNSTEKGFRPVSIGNDTKNAQYQRARRLALKEQVQHPELMAPAGNMMSYADIAKKASCTKQTVINRISSLGWTEHIKKIGQKKMVPYNISQCLIAVIQDHPIRKDILDSLRLDGYRLDGLDGYHVPSNTVKQPSNEPSNIVKQPSNDDTEKLHDKSKLDGLSNDNPSEILDDNLPLIESIRNKELQEDIYSKASKTVKERELMIDLFHVAFDDKPTDSDLSLLCELYHTTQYNNLLAALKTTRKYKANNIAYTKTCIERNHATGDYLDDSQIVIPGRKTTWIKSLIDEEFRDASSEERERIIAALQKYSDFYSDHELVDCIRWLVVCQESSERAVHFFIRHTLHSENENDDSMELWERHKAFLDTFDPANTVIAKILKEEEEDI
ncbi:MAG: hypothetical protein LKE48_09105 [Solobacterium sp.]|nr:hypothetical protein [Solobacterium sp.]